MIFCTDFKPQKLLSLDVLDLYQLGFDILTLVLATFPNIGQIFVQFSGHSALNLAISWY
jgi:hypothetical protein